MWMASLHCYSVITLSSLACEYSNLSLLCATMDILRERHLQLHPKNSIHINILLINRKKLMVTTFFIVSVIDFHNLSLFNIDFNAFKDPNIPVSK